ELLLGTHATAARREGQDYVLALDDGRELRGDHLLAATGRRPRVAGIGLETVGITAGPHGIPVDPPLRAGEPPRALRDAPARARASGWGPSAAPPACGCSPTSASTRAGSSPRPSSASPASPTTRPSPTWSTPTRKRPRSAHPRARSAPPRRCPGWPRRPPTPAP